MVTLRCSFLLSGSLSPFLPVHNDTQSTTDYTTSLVSIFARRERNCGEPLENLDIWIDSPKLKARGSAKAEVTPLEAFSVCSDTTSLLFPNNIQSQTQDTTVLGLFYFNHSRPGKDVRKFVRLGRLREADSTAGVPKLRSLH